MAVFYRVVERKNTVPGGKNETNAYALTHKVGVVKLKELAEDISNRCTVHRADVKAVLDAMSSSVVFFLKQGYGVELGELGNMSLRFKSKSTPTKEEFTKDNITQIQIRFTPAKELKEEVATFELQDLDEFIHS